MLIGFEKSGVVRDAFRNRGHIAWSCDLRDGVGPYHMKMDIFQAMRFQPWDIIILHPPCTYINVAGIHWNNRGRGWEQTEMALDFVFRLMGSANQFARLGWALENPVGLISTRLMKATQYIQPYDFGEDASKKTGLWLSNLPKLAGTSYTPPRIVVKNGKEYKRWGNQTDSGQNRLGPSESRADDRARTYPGIANAMADQWGKLNAA